MAESIPDRALRLAKIAAGQQVAAPDPTSQAEAQARQRELLNDPEWRQRAANGDPDTLAEIERLSRTILGPEAPWLGRR
jgi:hypothetical protein